MAAHGLKIAEAFEAGVHVLHVLNVRCAAGPIDAGGVEAYFLDRLESAGRSAVQAIESRAREREVDEVRLSILEGDSEEVILDLGPSTTSTSSYTREAD